MPRARTPAAKAKVTGAAVLHPGRHKGRKEPKSTALGEPSDWMGGEQRVAWASFQRELPWLLESHRTLVEIAACLRARLMSGEEVGVQALAQLRMCLSAMGATPVDASKVMAPDSDDSDDPAAAYFN